jgi:hypothetical protein
MDLRYFRAEIPLDTSLAEIAEARVGFAGHRPRPGTDRDKDIENCRAVIRQLGRLGVSVLVPDWLPPNTFAMAMTETRGYIIREFRLSDCRSGDRKAAF